MDYLNMLERLYIFDGFAGWDPEVRLLRFWLGQESGDSTTRMQGTTGLIRLRHEICQTVITHIGSQGSVQVYVCLPHVG